METKTASKVKVFLVKSQESKREPKNGSSTTLPNKATLKKELAKHDLEAQELINQILNIVENR